MVAHYGFGHRVVSPPSMKDKQMYPRSQFQKAWPTRQVGMRETQKNIENARQIWRPTRPAKEKIPRSPQKFNPIFFRVFFLYVDQITRVSGE